jgi:3-hydroxyacyl-CoA dehydrogenase
MPQKTRSKLSLQKFARVGTVTQGTQIAAIAPRAGYQATVFDPHPGALHQAYEKARGRLQGQEGQTNVLWNQGEACAAKVQQVQDLRETVQDAELVLAAVSDEDTDKQVSNR